MKLQRHLKLSLIEHFYVCLIVYTFFVMIRIQIPDLGALSYRYYSLIFEAISSTKDPRGADFNTIATFIEVRYKDSSFT